MDPLEDITATISTYLSEAHTEAQTQVKTWIGQNIMTLTPAEVDKAMRIVKSIERLNDHVATLTTGMDMEEASWKRRILTAARESGGTITTDRLREWMLENVTFNDFDMQRVKYGNETTVRWWHSCRPNLTYMIQDGTLIREKHGTYAITPEGEAYLDH